MPRYCPGCGEEMPDNARFCKGCGQSLEGGQIGKTIPKPEKSYRTAIIVGYLMALAIPIFGFVVGIYLFSRRDSKSAKTHSIFIMIISVVRYFIFGAFFG